MAIQPGRIKLNDEWTVCLESVDESERFTVDLVAKERPISSAASGWYLQVLPEKLPNELCFPPVHPDPTKPVLFNEQGYYPDGGA